jgi:hypothetical protein
MIRRGVSDGVFSREGERHIPNPGELQQRTELARGEQLVEQFFVYAIIRFAIADIDGGALRGAVGNRACAVLGRPWCPPC